MTTTDDRSMYEGWTVLELMGHRRLVGYLSEVQIAGSGFLRIQVPGENGGWAAEQLYAPAAVYAITPTTEETARRMAERSSSAEQVTPFSLPEPRVRWPCQTEDCHGSLAVPEDDSLARCGWCFTEYRVERTADGVLFHVVNAAADDADASEADGVIGAGAPL